MATFEVMDGDTVTRPIVRGEILLGEGATVIEPDVDADGGLYCIRSMTPIDAHLWRGRGMAEIARLFMQRRNVIVRPKLRGATNKAILGSWTEVGGGQMYDLGNDAIAAAGPMWAHGLRAPMVIDRLGLTSLDPVGHSDGMQPWAPMLIEGAILINVVPFGPGYEERGAGIYVEPDFGQCGPVIIRNGVSIRTRHGYAIQVVPKSGTGPTAGLEPAPVIIRGIYVHREDGKHPVNIVPTSTVFEGVRDLVTGRAIGRVPGMAA